MTPLSRLKPYPPLNAHYFFCLVTCLSVFSCGAPRQLTADHPTYIAYGSMGGFAGSYTEYRLMPNGQIFLRSRHQGEFEECESIESSQTDQFFHLVQDFYSRKMHISDPGNMTYFLIYVDSEETQLELSWGGDRQPVDERLKVLHRSLHQLSSKKVYTR